MMCIRIAVRAPLMMIFSIIMAFIMGGRLALTFVVIVPVLVVGLFFIAREAMPRSRAVSASTISSTNPWRKTCARCAW